MPDLEGGSAGSVGVPVKTSKIVPNLNHKQSSPTTRLRLNVLQPMLHWQTLKGLEQLPFEVQQPLFTAATTLQADRQGVGDKPHIES